MAQFLIWQPMQLVFPYLHTLGGCNVHFILNGKWYPLLWFTYHDEK